MPSVQKTSREFVFKPGWVSIFPLLLIFLSCATVQPVEGARGPLESFGIEAVRPQWQPFKEGAGYFHGKTVKPHIEFWALQIDLFAPEINIVVKGGAMDRGLTLSTRTSSFVRGNSLAAGINSVPFDVVSSKEGRPITNIGIVISGGELIAPANPAYDALIFYADGRAAVVSQAGIHSAENIENAAGGFHIILIDGQPAERTLNLETRHPRSAAGISANGRYLYLLVIDGRRPGSIGATEKETALLLRSLGSTDGINLDGGGSSALALRYPDGKVRTANTPIHGGIPGKERAVAGCIGIAVNPSTEK